jgi:hypothetical protein
MSVVFSSMLDDLSSLPSLTGDGDPPSSTGGLAVGLGGAGGRKKLQCFFIVEASEAAGKVCSKVDEVKAKLLTMERRLSKLESE